MFLNNITIGADPELFIVNSKTNKVVSSIGLIPGEKGDPYVDDYMPNGFGLEIDNILAEFNIPPVTTKEQFVNNILWMQNYIKDFVKRKNPDLDIECIASRIVDEDQLTSKEAKLFGCSVDYNAYTQSENPKPKGESTNLRSAGFHIHFGYDDYNAETSLQLVKLFDIFLGIPSVLLDPDNKRRSLYGKAGAFRVTSYGLEYRVLSSYMMSSVELLEKVWKGIQRVISYTNGKKRNLPRTDLVQYIINDSDVKTAKNVCEQFNLFL